MKKLISSLFTVTILSITSIVGCKNASDPKEIANKFLRAIYDNNFDEAKKYATADSKSMLDMFASFSNMMTPEQKQKNKNAKIEIKDMKVEGDMATVTYFASTESKDQTLKLKKEDGRWKVAFTKESIIPEDLNGNASPADSSRPVTDTTARH